MLTTLAPTLPQPGTPDVAPGEFTLPTLRRFYPDGPGDVVPFEDAAPDDVAALILDTLKFRRLVLEAITAQLSAATAVQLRLLNASEHVA